MSTGRKFVDSLWMLELPIVVTTVGWWMLVVGKISGLIVFTGSFTMIRGWVCLIWYCPLLFMLMMQFMFDCSMRLKSSCLIIDVEGMSGLTSFTTAVCCWRDARKLCCCCCCVFTSGTWCRICKSTKLLQTFPETSQKSHLFVSINIVRVTTSLAFTIDASFRVDVARTTLTTTSQLARRRRRITTSATSSLLRVIGIWGGTCRRCHHIRLLKLLLDGRPLEVWVHYIFSLYNGHLQRKRKVIDTEVDETLRNLHCCWCSREQSAMIHPAAFS